MKILEFLLFFVLLVVIVLIGAVYINCAVKHFKEEKYFSFGVDLILAFSFAIEYVVVLLKTTSLI
jgi:hypothetical protein